MNNFDRITAYLLITMSFFIGIMVGMNTYLLLEVLK